MSELHSDLWQDFFKIYLGIGIQYVFCDCKVFYISPDYGIAFNV